MIESSIRLLSEVIVLQRLDHSHTLFGLDPTSFDAFEYLLLAILIAGLFPDQPFYKTIKPVPDGGVRDVHRFRYPLQTAT
jgi:hypothetical protein